MGRKIKNIKMKSIDKINITEHPWNVRTYKSLGHIEIFSARECAIANLLGGDTNKRNIHNARMMAAAPEMYAALYGVRIFMEWCANHPDKSIAEKAMRHYNEVVAALARAAGKETK